MSLISRLTKMLKGIDATVFFRRGNHNPIFVKKITNENDKSKCIDDEQSQIRNENEHPLLELVFTLTLSL